MLILVQGLTSSLCCMLCLAAVTLMPVPDALCIIFSAPVPTVILARIVLKVFNIFIYVAFETSNFLRNASMLQKLRLVFCWSLELSWFVDHHSYFIPTLTNQSWR